MKVRISPILLAAVVPSFANALPGIETCKALNPVIAQAVDADFFAGMYCLDATKSQDYSRFYEKSHDREDLQISNDCAATADHLNDLYEAKAGTRLDYIKNCAGNNVR